MRARATILHADLDAFYASVEQRDDPGTAQPAGHRRRWGGACRQLRGARPWGADRDGWPLALRLCPEAVVVHPRIDAYSEASKAVFEVFEDTTPMVEGISIDEAFLDVGGLLRVSGEPIAIARRLRDRVRSEVGLPITVGVARTKFLAKVASGVAKPDGLLVVEPGIELDFLHPLPVERLWGVGQVTAAKLHDRGIATVGEVALLTDSALVAMLGPASGRHLHALAHNYDPRPVLGRRRRSIGSQRAFGLRPMSSAALDEILVAIIDRVARRLRKAERLTRTVVLRMRFNDFTRATRSHTLNRADRQDPGPVGRGP